MKAIWLYLKLNYPMWLFASLAVTVVSLLFISLVDVNNVVEPIGSDEYGYTLFGLKAFYLFSVVLMWGWVMIVYQNRSNRGAGPTK